MPKNSIGIFLFLIIFYFLFNYMSISIHAFDNMVNFYLFLVVSGMLFSFYTLDKMRFFKIDLNKLDNKKIIKLLFTIYILSISLFILISKNNFLDLLNYQSLVLDKYQLRLQGISVPYYFIFQIFTAMGIPLSIIFFLQKNRILLLVTMFFYFLFYFYSMQKAPLATMFLILFIVYIINNKITFQLIVYSVFGLLLSFTYFYFLAFNEFKLEYITYLLSGFGDRVFVAGEIISYTYNYFDGHELLNGATFPRFMGILQLNVLEGESVRLPSLMMKEMTGSSSGGANASFITDGFANFGYGFDIVFIVIVFGFTTAMIYFSKIFIPFLSTFYKLMLSVLLIDLVHIAFWGYLTKSILLYIMFFGLNMIIKRKNKHEN